MSCNSAKAVRPRVFVIDADAERAGRMAAVLGGRLECRPLTLMEPSAATSADLVVLVAASTGDGRLPELRARFGGAPVIVVTDSHDDRTATEWILAGADDVVCEADAVADLGKAGVRAIARARRRGATRPRDREESGARMPPTGGRKSRINSLVAFLQAAALTDPLTGLANRRALDARMKRLWADSTRDGQDLSVLMIDLDNFKQTNDRFGHAGGDAVLIALAEAMRAQSRKGDVAGRFGGDEVVLFLPRADAGQAHAVAERLREDFIARASQTIAGRAGSTALFSTMSLSIGVASRQVVGAASAADLLLRADEALYVAKGSGKGCTHVSEGPGAGRHFAAV